MGCGASAAPSQSIVVEQPEPSNAAAASTAPAKTVHDACAAPVQTKQNVCKDKQRSTPPFEVGSNVVIFAIEKRPELNGQVGVILSFDGGEDRRYTVNVMGTSVKLKECKLADVPAVATDATKADVAGEDRVCKADEAADETALATHLPALSPDSGAVSPQLPAHCAKFEDMSHVMISGIEKKPELNGQIGQIVSCDGGVDPRYTVRVLGSLVKLRASKLASAPAPEQSHDCFEPSKAAVSLTTDADLDWALSQCRDNPQVGMYEKFDQPVAEMDEQMPMGELNARGQLIPSYDWAQVPEIASLPPGLEIWMPLVGMKCARIPDSWRVQVIAEGQVDSYRCNVGKHTPVVDVIFGAAAAFGWPPESLRLRVDGGDFEVEEEATVGSASLFGRKLTARQQE